MPKRSSWKAKGSKQWRKGTEQWYDWNIINGDGFKITCLDKQRTNKIACVWRDS